MARNRMIKPEFWSSGTLMNVSMESRLTFIGIWNFCDDYGFCLNNMRSLLGDIYPLDDSVSEVKIRKWIDELISEKLLIPVRYRNKSLLLVKGWGEHQTVQHKSKRSYVEPDDIEGVIKATLESHEDLVNIYLESHAPKRKKKEKEGRESNKEESNKAKSSSMEEVVDFCIEIGLTYQDGEFLWYKWEENGWMNGNKPIRDWKATIRKWKAGEFLPSQKKSGFNPTNRNVSQTKSMTKGGFNSPEENPY